MSRYFNSFMDDYSEALEHSWGTSPKAKAREKEYNHWYYQKHKAEIEAVRKQRSAATNSYKQAEKSHNDAVRYYELSDQMDARLHGWKMGPRTKTSENDGYSRKVTPIYEWGGLDQDENSPDRYAGMGYNGSKARHLTMSANSRLESAKATYQNKAELASRQRDYLISKGAWQNAKAKDEAKKILRGLKNPTAKDLAEFYLDTTVEKAKKSANKAKKYVTKSVSNAEKASNKAKKYATKAMFTAEKAAEKAANKAKKYATKTVKSAANKAKKYVKE